jgi:hypothetical protein
MGAIPAQCQTCGHLWDVSAMFALVGQIHLQGNIISCRVCGGSALIGDGAFELSYDGGLKYLGGSQLTWQMIDRLKDVAQTAKEKIQKGGIDAEDILTEIADISPELAVKLRERHSLPSFVIILILFWLVKGFSLDVKIDLNKAIDQACHIMQGSDPLQHLEQEFLPPADIQVSEEPLGPPLHLAKFLASQDSSNRRERRRLTALARRRARGKRRM